MKIENTQDAPLAVFHIKPDGSREERVLQPGESFDVAIEPGDSVQARIATELIDAPEV